MVRVSCSRSDGQRQRTTWGDDRVPDANADAGGLAGNYNAAGGPRRGTAYTDRSYAADPVYTCGEGSTIAWTPWRIACFALSCVSIVCVVLLVVVVAVVQSLTATTVVLDPEYGTQTFQPPQQPNIRTQLPTPTGPTQLAPPAADRSVGTPHAAHTVDVQFMETQFRLARRTYAPIMWPPEKSLPGTGGDVGGSVLIPLMFYTNCQAGDAQLSVADVTGWDGEFERRAGDGTVQSSHVVVQRVPDAQLGGLYIEAVAVHPDAAGALCTVTYAIRGE